MAPTSRPPRRSMPGKQPHAAAEAARQQLQADMASKSSQRERGGHLSHLLSRGFSRSSSHRDGSRPGSAEDEPGSVDSLAIGSPGSLDGPGSPASQGPLSASPLSNDADRVGHSIPIVGAGDDPSVNVDTRKKNALARGPLINLDHSLHESYGLRPSLLTALKDLFECISENDSSTGVASPQYFVETLKKENELFRSSMHQDAHEFLNFLLNKVIEEVNYAANSAGLPNPTWVDDLFMGEFTNETRCMSCETVSRRNEQFVDFSIDVGNNSSVVYCLDQFSASEILGGANKFYCDNCGGLQEAEKRMKVRRAPRLLTLHLKRFKFSEDQQRNVKLLHRVLYSQYLRLPVTTDDCDSPDRLYELTSVIVHLGGGPYQGHYVAITKTENGGWLLFDDELVEAVSSRYVYRFFGDKNQLATAYLLFYQEIPQEQYENDNALLSSGIPVPTLVPHSREDDQDSLLTSSDIYGMTMSEEDEPLPGVPPRRPSTASSGAASDSLTTTSAAPQGASLNRYDSVKRRQHNLFGVFRRGS